MYLNEYASCSAFVHAVFDAIDRSNWTQNPAVATTVFHVGSDVRPEDRRGVVGMPLLSNHEGRLSLFRGSRKEGALNVAVSFLRAGRFQVGI